MKDILLYSDEGADPRSVKWLAKALREEIMQPVRLVNGEYLAAHQWEETTSLIAFPGGRDIPYHQKLQGKETLRIRRFVEEGGRYLGICAGAYFACRSFEFEKGYPLEVLAERELAFFPGHAQGPAYDLNRFHYNSEEGAVAACISWNCDNSSFNAYIYFNGGCLFVNPENHSQVNVLARYNDLEGSPAAIVGCTIGKGKALLSGVHPEYNTARSSAICERLQQTEPLRKKLIHEMLAYFNRLDNLCVRFLSSSSKNLFSETYTKNDTC